MVLVLSITAIFAVEITGSVVNSQKKSVYGASILLDGSRFGTSTNKDGGFSFNVSNTETITLIFSHISYPTMSRTIELSDAGASFDLGEIVFADKSAVFADPVVVSATRSFHRVKDSPAQISVVDTDEIEAGKIESIADALRWTPGVNISGGAPGGSTGRFTMLFQGLPGQYSLVLYKGRKLLSEHIHTGTNLNMVPVSNIDRLEVMPGAASAQYGAEALGGVLNIIPIAPGQGPLIRAAYSFGTYQTHGISLFHDNHIGNRFSYNIALDYNKTNGDEGEEVNGDMRYEYGFRRWDVNLQSKYFITDRIIANLDYFHTKNVNFKDEYAIDDGELDISDGDWLANPSLALTYLGNRSSIRFNSYLSNFEYEMKNTVNRKLVSEAEYFVNIGKSSALAGVNFENQSFIRISTPENARAAVGAYIQSEINEFDNIMTLVSARFDFTEDVGGSFNPKLNLTYAPIEAVRLRTSAGTGQKVPSLQELYEHHYPHKRTVDGETDYYYRDGNPDLKPEQSTSLSVSTEWFPTDNLYFGITGYRNNLTDMIELQYVGVETDTANYDDNDIFRRENIASAYTQGIQFDAIVRPVKYFRIGGNYAYMDSKNEDNDTRLAFSPEHTFNVRLGIDMPALGAFKIDAFTGYSYSMNRYYYHSREWQERKLDDYKMLEANVSVMFREMVEFYIKGNNLLDLELTTYEEGKQATGGGRYFAAGIRFKY